MRTGVFTIAPSLHSPRARRFPRVAQGFCCDLAGLPPSPRARACSSSGRFARIDVYDLRAHERTEDLAALSADGGMIEARASVLTYHPVPEELVALAREVGT